MKSADPAAYKARKEAFVSNLSGSSLTNINLVTLTAPIAILLWTVLQKRHSFFRPDNPVAILVDFFLNVCAILFAFTAYSSAPTLLIFLLTVPLLPLLLEAGLSSSSSKSNPDKSTKKKQNAKPPVHAVANTIPNRPFITHYRGAMMVATCMAILAVDFPIFPRRFAKVETWGTSLMDLGVGSFVFSAGVVSARQILNRSSSTSQNTDSSRPAQKPLPKRLISSLRHSVPLFILGLIRLYSVKGLDYAEHVTEYGVHWNFFFTLGLLPPFTELADTLVSLVSPATTAGPSSSSFSSLLVNSKYDILAILITFTYELILSTTPLLPYILISPRGPTLLSQNREGVFSFTGYFAIFLSGRGVGSRIVPWRHSGVTATTTTKTPTDAASLVRKDLVRTLTSLLFASTIYTALFLLSTSYLAGLGLNVRVSRRLANAPYALWIASFNSGQILLFAGIEYVGHLVPSSSSSSTSPSSSTSTSTVMHSYNRHGLPVFLVANLLTGVVNLTVNTLDASNVMAMGVLVLYAAAVTGVAVGMEGMGWKVKL